MARASSATPVGARRGVRDNFQRRARIARLIRYNRAMQIFIDESGTFAQSGRSHAISLVGALCIPDRRLPYIEKRYLKIRHSLPTPHGEVKGRTLSEEQVDQVVSMLAEHDVLFHVNA